MNLIRRCFDCGQPLGKKDVFCPRCGAKQPRDPKEEIDRINMINKINSDAKPLFKGFVFIFRSNPVNPVNPVYCF
jgi:uncharacterized Zn finger protein (UPF0148 family)